MDSIEVMRKLGRSQGAISGWLTRKAIQEFSVEDASMHKANYRCKARRYCTLVTGQGSNRRPSRNEIPWSAWGEVLVRPSLQAWDHPPRKGPCINFIKKEKM